MRPFCVVAPPPGFVEVTHFLERGEGPGVQDLGAIGVIIPSIAGVRHASERLPEVHEVPATPAPETAPKASSVCDMREQRALTTHAPPESRRDATPRKHHERDRDTRRRDQQHREHPLPRTPYGRPTFFVEIVRAGRALPDHGTGAQATELYVF